MTNQRTILWALFAAMVFLTWSKWQADRAPTIESAQVAADTTSEGLNQPTVDSTSQADELPVISDSSTAEKPPAVAATQPIQAEQFVSIKTDVLDIQVSKTGRTLVSAALRFCREQTEAKRVVSLAPDTGNKYLSKLYNDFWLEDQGFTTREAHGDLRDLVGRPHGERATITVGPGDVLTTAHNRLRNAGFSQLPVMHEGKLVGVVTEDTIIRFVFGKPELMNAPVKDAMQTEFIRLEKDASLNNLVAMLQVQPYAAVMDGDAFLGLITRSDVLNHLRKQA